MDVLRSYGSKSLIAPLGQSAATVALSNLPVLIRNGQSLVF